MKIVIIYGSPRKGITYEAVRVVKNEMQQYGAVEFAEFHLPQDAPVFCKGCFQCFLKGEAFCPDARHIQPIVDAMMNADGFIFSTPVYAMHISGGLKAFLDHLAYCYINHRPRFMNRKALVIVTTAGDGIKNCLGYISQNLRFWGINKVYTFGQPVMAADWEGVPPKIKTKLLRGLKKTARVFHHDISSGKLYPPTFLQAIMYYAGKALMLSNGDGPNPDKEYWQKKGWLEKDCRYLSSQTKPGPLKECVGRMAFFVMRRVIGKK